MKQLNKILSTISLAIIILIAPSCKKNDPAPAAGLKIILLNKTWKMTDLTVNPAYNGMTNAYATLDECEKDNLYQFNDAGILLMTDIIKCNPTAADTSTGTWSYDENSKILKLVYSPPGVSYDLEYLVNEVKDTYFKAMLGFTENGITYYFTYTFTKQ